MSYHHSSELLDKSKKYLDKFGLKGFDKPNKFIVPLEKVLQTVLAFVSVPQDAVQNKSRLLKNGTEQNKKVIDFIKDTSTRDEDIFNLYLLYLRAEQEKKERDGKNPNPFYLIYCIAHYECHHRAELLGKVLSDKETIDNLLTKYSRTLRMYSRKWNDKNNSDYNDMIKSVLDMNLLDSCKNDAEDYD